MSISPPSRPRNYPMPMCQVQPIDSPAVARKGSSTESALPNSETLTREARIELAAYYRAQRRGFVPAQELADWLAAEFEIDGLSARAMI
jgi:hypothetical protein